ncbi:hypothetical protein CYMTET_35831, partial [Cymbomonas tetramitiformis]
MKESRLAQIADEVRGRLHPITKLLLKPHVIQQYERVFHKVVKNTSSPLPRSKMLLFLQVLIPGIYITTYHIREFQHLFESKHQESIEWTKMRRILREYMEKTKKDSTIPIFVKDTFVLHPKYSVLQVWDILYNYSGLYYFITVPINIAFADLTYANEELNLYVSVVVDTLMVLHIVLRFNMAYTDSNSILITDRSLIAKSYLSSDFIMNLLPALPIDYLIWAMGHTRQTVAWFSSLKILRVSTLYKAFMNKLSKNKTILNAILNLMCLLVCVEHMGACVWYYIGRNNGDSPGWFDPEAENPGMYFPPMGMRHESGIFERYLLSMLWVTSTLSTFGVGSAYLPHNFTEVAFVFCLMFMSMTLYSYVLGEISNQIMSADERVVKERAEMSRVENFIKKHSLSEDLQSLITNHYYSTLRGEDVHAMADIFNQMSHLLRVDVAKITTRDVVDRLTLFKGCSGAYLDIVSVYLKEVAFTTGEVIFHAGEIARDMYIVSSGIVEMLQVIDGVEVPDGMIKRGGMLGELAFFFSMRHVHTARSIQTVKLFELSRASFAPLMKLFPDEERTIASNALLKFDEAKTHYSKSHAATSIHE